MRKAILLAIILAVTTSTQAAAEERFENSLGMNFVEVSGANLLFSVYPTRVSDYRAFVLATWRSWPAPPFEQSEDHPAVNISWEDAVLFCQWLTEQENLTGELPVGWIYRLPTEVEWMTAALGEAIDAGWDEPVRNRDGLFPWGESWPPPPGAGNYAEALGVDPFPDTSPVGTFAPNPIGLYDTGGNVWEWTLDFFEGAQDLRTLKGASFRMRNFSDLLISTRVGNVASLRFPTYGFRVVIERPTE